MRLCAEQKVAQEMSSVSFDDLKEVISGPTPEFQTSLEKREVKVKVKRVCCTKGSGFAAVVVYIEIIGPTQDETRQSAMEDVRAGVDRPNGGQAGSQDPPAKDAQPVRTQEQNNGNGGERIPFRGLTNDPDENLCYINSVMQVLARTEPFASFCLQRQHEHDKRSKEQACAEHIRLAHKQQDSSVFRSPVAAHAFLARNESKKKPWPHYFPKGTQQDADEFFTWLLTSKVGAKFNTRVDAEFDALVTEAQADDEFYDVVKETFYFEVFNRRTCKTCTHVDNTPEIMQKLNLSIVNENVHSIKQALDAYMACAELITDYTCETCRLLSPQSKTYVLREVPKIFTLQLERFDSTRRKVSKNIAIDERLELQTDTGTSKVKFELFAIIVHRGATLDQGHYVTYLRDFGNDASKVDKLSSQSKWYLLNDAIVTLVDWDQAVKSEDIQRGAYMLFYRRTERRDVAGAGIRQTSTVLPPTPQKQIQQSVTKGISMEVEGQPEKQQQPERMGNQEQQKESKKRKEREIAQSQVNVQEEAAAGAAGAQATSASRSHPRHKITVKDSDCPTCKHTWKAGKGTNLQVSNAKKNCKANGRRCITVKFKLQVTQSATKVNSTDVEGGPDKQLQKKARGHVKDNRAGGKVQTGKRGAAGAGADADAATVSKEDRRKEKRKANRALPVGDKKCNNCHHTWKAGLLNKGEFDYAQSSCRHGRSCVEQEKGRVPKTVQRDAKDEKGPESRAPVDKRRGKDGSQTARGGATEASIDDDDEQGTDEEATEESDVDYDPPSSSRSKKRVEPKSTQAASAARRARVERQEATARLPMAERSRPTANSRKPQRGSREYNQDASAPPRKGNKEEEEAVAAAMAATAPGGTSSPRGMGGFSSDSSDF
jgi:ubiquitin C-terminal hydrolase